jgi:hypothetical protein
MLNSAHSNGQASLERLVFMAALGRVQSVFGSDESRQRTVAWLLRIVAAECPRVRKPTAQSETRTRFSYAQFGRADAARLAYRAASKTEAALHVSHTGDEYIRIGDLTLWGKPIDQLGKDLR